MSQALPSRKRGGRHQHIDRDADVRISSTSTLAQALLEDYTFGYIDAPAVQRYAANAVKVGLRQGQLMDLVAT